MRWQEFLSFCVGFAFMNAMVRWSRGDDRMIDFMLDNLGWIANVFILISMWELGRKKRSAFIWAIVGDSLWVAAGLMRGSWDVASICIVFTLMAGFNWWRWGPPEPTFEQKLKGVIAAAVQKGQEYKVGKITIVEGTPEILRGKEVEDGKLLREPPPNVLNEVRPVPPHKAD